MYNTFKIRCGFPADARLAAAAKRAGLPRGMALALWIALRDATMRGTEETEAEDLAAALEFDTPDVAALLKAFRDKKMIRDNGGLYGDTAVSPVTVRTRRHRARKRRQKRDNDVWRDDPDDPAAIESRRARLLAQRNAPTKPTTPRRH